MHITNALIKLRDDLKGWVACNLMHIKESIPTKLSDLENDINLEFDTDSIVVPTKLSELENDTDYVTGTELTLGIHEDRIYIFRNGEPIGDGVMITDGTPIKITNLMETGELYLNQRYSKSGGGLVTDDVASGMFALIFPIECTDINTVYTLNFKNLKVTLTASTNATMFLLDANKANPVNVNGHNTFRSMTEGRVTVGDLVGSVYTTGTVTFSCPSTDIKYVVISLEVVAENLTTSDIKDYVVELY